MLNQTITKTKKERMVVMEKFMLEKKINKKLRDLGFKTRVVVDLEDGEMKFISKELIDQKSVGILQHALKDVEVKISVGLGLIRNTAVIILDYHWNHPWGGSNGSTVRFRSHDGNDEWSTY